MNVFEKIEAQQSGLENTPACAELIAQDLEVKMKKKYEFTGEVKEWFGKTLHQIRAAAAFGDVSVGDIGGWIEREENLSHSGNAWVCGDARVRKQSHWLCIGPIGSRDGYTTFFRTEGEKIFVKCGCFLGDIDAFALKVRAVHGGSDHAKAYMAAVESARIRIDLSGEEKSQG